MLKCVEWNVPSAPGAVHVKIEVRYERLGDWLARLHRVCDGAMPHGLTRPSRSHREDPGRGSRIDQPPRYDRDVHQGRKMQLAASL